MTRTLFVAFWAYDTFVELSCHTLRELRFFHKMQQKYNSHLIKSFFVHPNHNSDDPVWYSSCEEAIIEFRELTIGEKSLMRVPLSSFLFVIQKESLTRFLTLLSGGETETTQAILSASRIYNTEIFIDDEPASKLEVMLILPLIKKINHYTIDLNLRKVRIKNFSLS